MECPSCHHVHRADAKFCTACGMPLPVLCSHCGSANPSAARFCGDCGAKLPEQHAASAKPPSPSSATTVGAERRQLTVMFCDLVGSTGLSARHDPEDMRDLIAAYRKCVTYAVARFDGFIARYLGDGVLVYFGYPQAHEDDAERAVRAALGRLREAEALAERLDDDHRRGRVCALMTSAHASRGELDEALATASRALEIAGRLGDLKLRISSTAYLEVAHYFRGDYERVVELATDNLATLPTDRIYEYCGLASPASVYCRVWLIESLAQLGRFAEAAEHEAKMIRLAEPTHHAFTVGLTYYASATLHLPEGDWVKARASIERATAVARAGNVVVLLPTATASAAWVLAQLGEASEALNRLREGEQLLQRQAARGMVADRAWAYHALSRACLLLGLLDEAHGLCDRVVESSPCHPGFAAWAQLLFGDIASHSDRLDAERGDAHYRQALALAEPRGMRPLIAHCHLGLGKLYWRTGKREQGHEHLTNATALYREMDMSFWLELAEVEMGQMG
jgi:tetratricopeptide (TPR) repeat protein